MTAEHEMRDALGREYDRFEQGPHSLEYMVRGGADMQPLLLLHSLEYPGWPPVGFCQQAEAAGFRVIAVRRPGFGANPPMPDVEGQARLIADFLQAEDMRDSIVVSTGTAGPVGHRLALDDLPHVKFSIFANCGFNYDQIAEFQPEWYARTLEQALRSIAGARLSLIALKSSWGIFGRKWVHQTILQKSPGDIAFLRDNPDLLLEVIENLLARLDVHTFMMEVGASLNTDPLLVDGCFRDCSALVVSGMETTDSWKQGIENEAARLGLAPVVYLPSGDALTVYQSPEAFFTMVQDLR